MSSGCDFVPLTPPDKGLYPRTLADPEAGDYAQKRPTKMTVSSAQSFVYNLMF